MNSLLRDVRFGARSLTKSPVLAAAAVLTLAIGIGANTAVFSLVHALLLEAMPVRAPQGLFWLSRTLGPGEMSISDGERVDFTSHHPDGLLVECRRGNVLMADAA